MNSKVLLPNEILLEIFRQSLPLRVDQQGRLASKSFARSAQDGGRYHFPRRRFGLLLLWRVASATGGTMVNMWAFWTDGSPEQGHASLWSSSMWNEEQVRCGSMRKLPWRLSSSATNPDGDGYLYSLNPIVFGVHSSTLPGPPSNWTNLGTLALWTFDFAGHNKERAAVGFDMLEKFTSLRSLSLEVHHGYGFRRRFGPINLGVIRITLEDHFGIQEIRLISAYSNLTNLALIAPANCEWNLSPHDDLTLPSLSTFVFDTFDLSLLEHLVTPSLANLDIHLHWDVPWPQSGFLDGFLARCTTTLRSVTLNSDREDSFVAKILPSLSTRPNLSHLTLDVWPSPVDCEPIPEEVEKDWCPQLRYLTVSIGSSDMVELVRMKGLARFLLRREAFGLPELERLTIHRRPRAVEFPYEFFKDVRLDDLRVMVPW